jgi:cobalt/nickel transport system permease protein
MTLPEWMKAPAPYGCPAGNGGKPRGFIEKSLRDFASVLKKGYATDRFAHNGAMQRLEPRAKLAGFFFLILAAALSESWLFLSALIGLTGVLSIITKAGAAQLLMRTFPAVVFTALLAAPAATGFVTPGEALVGTGGLAITVEGVRTALFFVLRVTSMAALASLAVLTTAQSDFFRGLGRLVPGFFMTALFFTFKFALILVNTAIEAALARKSRTIGAPRVKEAQGWVASRAALILKRSLSIAEEVSMAMVSRGFDGRVRTRAPGPLARMEYLWLGAASFLLFLSFGF